ncbi:MAG: hypothetical protein AABY64_04905 [Bdellovibrionota bacterium]
MLKKILFVFTFLLLLSGISYADNDKIAVKSARRDARDIHINYETGLCFEAVFEKEPICTEEGIEFLLVEKKTIQDCKSNMMSTKFLTYSIEKLRPLNCLKSDVLVKDKNGNVSKAELTREQIDATQEIFPARKSTLPTYRPGQPQPK